MKKIGRNEPCPCGSGRKYKTCCLALADASDFQFRLNRRLSTELIPRLIEFATHDSDFIDEAWVEFNGNKGGFDSDGKMDQLFMPWFLFNWELEIDGTQEADLVDVITIAELFLVANSGQLTTDEKDFILSSIRCPYTLCEVVEVKPGVGMTLFDLLRRIQYEVVERTASQTVKKGEIIYCATSELRGFRSNVGTGPYQLRPTSKRDVLDLRKWITDQIGTDKVTASHLHEFEDDIRWFYLDEMRSRLAPPILVNTDGHRMLPQKLYFDIDSADHAFHAFKDLAERDETALLEQAKVENGLVKSAEIPWEGGTSEARKQHSGAILLGLLKINDRRLVIDVNSQERADAIRKIVEERLDDHITYKTAKIEPLQPRVNEMWQTAAASGGSPADANPLISTPHRTTPLDDDPALSAMMKDLTARHWESWLELPIPVLNDMTPIEAAKTAEGRDLLESLLLEYENNASKRKAVFDPDIRALRRKLGMD